MRNRTVFIIAAILAAVVTTAAAIVLASGRQRIGAMQAAIQTLETRVRRLSYHTASGGGVNVKLMPDPATGRTTVPLAEVFSFDRNHAFCRVDTNPQAFTMPTHR